jgi:magnesium transporter
MLTVFLFDERESEQVEDWQAALERLADDELLWLALRDPTEEEIAALQEALELGDENAQRLLEQPSRASVADAGERMHVTLYAADIEEGGTVLAPIECALGRNWIITAHPQKIEVLEEFRERAEGGGQVGALDAPSFVAAIFEWIVTGYFRAFEAVESELEELDARVMSSTPTEVSDDLNRLVELRRSIGTLRRALSPHPEVVVALAHPELDALSTEDSAEKFALLESRLTQALDAARETKESTFGSFDLLVARIGQRTNDIMKVLTLVTVILLPATVLAGIMGMNFKVGLFDMAWMFWAVIAAMFGIAVLVLSVARNRTLDLRGTLRTLDPSYSRSSGLACSSVRQCPRPRAAGSATIGSPLRRSRRNQLGCKRSASIGLPRQCHRVPPKCAPAAENWLGACV